MKQIDIDLSKFDIDNLDIEKYWIDVGREFGFWMKLRLFWWMHFNKDKYFTFIVIYDAVHDIFDAYIIVRYRRYRMEKN